MKIECVMFDWMRTCVILNVCDVPPVRCTYAIDFGLFQGRQSPNAQALWLKG